MPSPFIRTTAFEKIRGMSKFYRIVQGGMSAGKTEAILMCILCIAMQKEHKLVSVVESTAAALRTGSMREWEKLLDAQNMRPYFTYRATDKMWTYNPTGTVVEFIALDDEIKARGPRRDVLFLNEANRIKWGIAEQMMGRTHDCIYIDYNPSSKFWAHTQIVENELRAGRVDFIVLTYLDNEAILPNDKEFIEEHSRTGNWWRVYGLGEIGELENNVYNGWERLDTLPAGSELLGYGIDYGDSPDPTAMVAVWKDNEGIVFEECFEQNSLRVSEYADLVQTSVEARGDGLIICDYGGGGAALIRELESRGLMVMKADKSAGSVLAGISSVQDIQHVSYVGCDIEREYLAYTHRVSRSGEVLPVPQDGDDHLLDALRYAWFILSSAIHEKEESLRAARNANMIESYEEEI